MQDLNRGNLIRRLSIARRIQAPAIGGEGQRRPRRQGQQARDLPSAQNRGGGTGSEPALVCSERQLVNETLHKVELALKVGSRIVAALIDVESQIAMVAVH